MNVCRVAFTALWLFGFLCLPLSAEQTEPSFDDFDQRVSYVLGLETGISVRDLPTVIDLDLFMRGLTDALHNRQPLLIPEEIDAVKTEFSRKLRDDREQRRIALGRENRHEEAVFFAQNRQDKDVITTDSGLQYKVLKASKGATPQRGDRVTVHYQGTLLNGTEFDSSYQRGQPAVLQLDQIIPGLSEALQLMQVGGKYRLFVPAKLAYGTQGFGDQIGPDAALIFDVELLDISR